jgi:4-diphosphocytidyl-2C-methyl-D-erythritol kinase
MYSQDWDITFVVMHKKQLVTYHELSTVYNTEQFYDLLEMLEFDSFVEDETIKEIKRQQNVQYQLDQQRNSRGR